MADNGIIIGAGNLRADIRPGIGGSLAGFWSETPAGQVDWVRRAGAGEIAAGDARGMGCYPLVPFSNRIRAGRFSFQGRNVSLPLNYLPHPHFLHGHGWRAEWEVVEKSADAARLRYHHAADAWPWPYLAEQRFSLADDGLTIEISITNLADTPMPAGIGLHPYFPRDAETTIAGDVAGFWESDSEVMPTRLVPAGSVWQKGSRLAVDRVALDNCFTGWGKALDVRVPGGAVGMDARGPLDFLIVFSPPGQRFFCAEPVSHCIDAFNLAHERGDTGTVSLEPGATLSAEVSFRPRQAA